MHILIKRLFKNIVMDTGDFMENLLEICWNIDFLEDSPCVIECLGLSLKFRSTNTVVPGFRVLGPSTA